VRTISSLKVTGRGRQGEYVVVRIPGHPFAMRRGWVYEHRWLTEKRLGRYLKPSELVHHDNESKKDNRGENLKLTSRSEHTAHHNPKRHRILVCDSCGVKFKRIFSQCSEKRGTKESFCSRPCRNSGKPKKHGTRRMYGAGCRCEECKAANARSVALWRASKNRAQG